MEKRGDIRPGTTPDTEGRLDKLSRTVTEKVANSTGVVTRQVKALDNDVTKRLAKRAR